MARKYDAAYVAQYTFLGFFIGLGLVVVTVLLQLLAGEGSLSWSFVSQLHRQYPSMYLVDLGPIVCAVFAFLVGRMYSRQRLVMEQTAKVAKARYNELLGFVRTLEGGEQTDYTPAADDTLGQTLLHLRDDIQAQRAEEAQRRQEDRQRSWMAEGLAEFGEILREDVEKLEELGNKLTSHLVKYIGANQCGFYIVEGEDVGDRHLRLLACYAYDRKKFAQQRLEWGDGLVGACIQEGVTSQFDSLPEGYLTITSGLGEATAKNLLLVPLLQDEARYGVLELASFARFEPHTVEFCERVASSIASTLASKRISIRTAQLLAESQKQAQILSEQEEQMRQNMEELQATQEEAARQSESFVSFTNSVNETLIRAEYKVDGTLIYANTKFLQKLEYNSFEEVQGKPISLFINFKDRSWFDQIWEGLATGGRAFEGDMKHVTRNGKDLWTIATYTCIKDHRGEVDRILFLAIDTTHDKKQNLDWQGQIDALNRVSLKVEMTPLGDIIAVNDKFVETLGYGRDAVLRKPVYTILSQSEQSNFERILAAVGKGENFEGTLRAVNARGAECWLRVSLTTVNDMYGDIAKIILIANDITREKLMEIATQRQTEQLREQEEKLRQNEVELSKKLRQAREEVKNQFREIEKIQVRNEKTLEGFLDAIITTDQEGVVEFFNRAAEELFGVDRSEVLGQNIRLLFPPSSAENSDFLKGYLDPQGKKIVGERREVQITTSKGEELSVLMLLSEAKVGRVMSYTAFIQNISLDLF